MKKGLKILGLSLVLIVILLFSYVNLAWDKNFDAPYPDITASTDSSIIARGSYLVYGPAHCAYCHVPPEKIPDVASGKKIPLMGGGAFDIPPAIFRTPNITPDEETGIGKFTDAQLARALRYTVKHDNKFMAPFMAFQELSDEDLKAIISFLRSQEPVNYKVEPNEYRFLGKALLAFGLLGPVGPQNTPPVSVAIDSTAEYGSYIANSVANCVGCHTNRDLKTGEFIGKPYAGGFEMEAEPYVVSQKGYKFVTPNLTPEKNTGIMAMWSEEVFINRLKSGRVHAGSPMPWEAYATMEEMELKAVYRYLKSLSPVGNNIPKIVLEPEE